MMVEESGPAMLATIFCNPLPQTRAIELAAGLLHFANSNVTNLAVLSIAEEQVSMLARLAVEPDAIVLLAWKATGDACTTTITDSAISVLRGARPH